MYCFLSEKSVQLEKRGFLGISKNRFLKKEFRKKFNTNQIPNMGNTGMCCLFQNNKSPRKRTPNYDNSDYNHGMRTVYKQLQKNAKYLFVGQSDFTHFEIQISNFTRIPKYAIEKYVLSILV